jgi:hypothetical protein
VTAAGIRQRTLQFRDALSQGCDDFAHLFFGVARRDVLGAIPIERDNVNEDEAFDDAWVRHVGQLIDEFRTGPGIFDSRVPQYFQSLAARIVHEEQCDAMVGAEVAGGDQLAVTPEIGECEGVRPENF